MTRLQSLKAHPRASRPSLASAQVRHKGGPAAEGVRSPSMPLRGECVTARGAFAPQLLRTDRLAGPGRGVMASNAGAARGDHRDECTLSLIIGITMRWSECPARVPRHPRTLRSLSLVAVIALALAAACTQSPEVRKQKAIERAEQYLKEGKPNEAVIELRNALQIDSEFVPALVALGRAYAAKGWHADAARELLRAAKLAPNDTSIALMAARELLDVGALRDADEHAGKVL